MNALLVCLSISVLPFSQDPQQATPLSLEGLPPGYIEINGAKAPTSIPDWLAWTNGLMVFAVTADNPDSVFYSELKLTPTERQLVADAALQHKARQEACEVRQVRIVNRLRDTDPYRGQELIRQDEIACRSAVLFAKDELLAKLSPGAARRLIQSVDDHRRKITVYVSSVGLEHFRRPR